MTNTLRGGLLGLGGVARQSHLPAFAAGRSGAHRLEIVATVDSRAAGVDGIPHFADVGALADLPIDFVDICTPTATHVDLTLWALESGFDVLCEKPVALSSRDVADIRAAAGSRRVIMPCHQYRFNPAWMQLRRWLEEGAIGAWHLAEFQVYRLAADAGAGPASDPWRGRRSDAGGGILLDHGTHLIYQLLDVAGMPRTVQAWTGRLRHRSYDVEDSAQLLLDYDGRLATFFLTWAGDRRETRIRFIGSDGSIEWSGGRLTLAGRHGPLELDFSPELDKSNYYGWFARLFREFGDRIARQDGQPPLEDIACVTRVLESAYDAHAGGCRVAV